MAGRGICLAIALLLPAAAAWPATPGEEPLWWRAPTAQEVRWRGMLPTEGGAVGMGPQIGLYPVAGTGGLLAAILTHAVIANSAQSSEYQKAQEASDRVLEPYSGALGAWTAIQLWEAAAAAAPVTTGVRIWDGQGPTDSGMVVESAPTFTMALDESVLILDATIRLSAPGKAPVESLVRVVSTPLGEVNPRTHWLAAEAGRLKSTAAAMLAHALDIARRHGRPPTGDGQTPMRTHRYLQGTNERTERAQQLAGDCARLELRNLRGMLMSVPVKMPADGQCKGRSAF